MDQTEALLAAAIEGDRRSLARLLSVIEAGGAEFRTIAPKVFAAGRGIHSIGLTGAPGAGKSSLTDALVAEVRGTGSRVAVVAVDPSSPLSGGAILGDRVRLREQHAADDDVYVRSLASRGQLGGLSLAVPEMVRALDATGWPVVLIETVGVGQSEVSIAENADTTVVVVNPGWGDEVQANKAGLLEIADVLVVNKADRPGVDSTVRDLERMLHLGKMRRVVAGRADDGGDRRNGRRRVVVDHRHASRVPRRDRRARTPSRPATAGRGATSACCTMSPRQHREQSGRPPGGRSSPISQPATSIPSPPVNAWLS